MNMTVRNPGEQTTKQRLNHLIEKFLADAKEIDPTIEGVYVGYDGPAFDRPFIINLERGDGWKLKEHRS
jgi:purine nucleoside phosphorylase